ncbi:unnamed protein product [Miscanthus lutarioriparius]|uniref:Uncharacterized protein n=1 Tax=Miscanthus lutarioriparius TaxID=422564 RepID=A0A811MP94_9POAL|nr:unnamed protein product [Miscanthus lutarioriparius]
MATTTGSSSSWTSMERSGERSPYSSLIPYHHPPTRTHQLSTATMVRRLPSGSHGVMGIQEGGIIHATNISFWVWLDPKPTDHQIEILVDLRDAIKALRNKNETLELEKNELSFLVDEAHVKNAELVKEKEEPRALVKELEAKEL